MPTVCLAQATQFSISTVAGNGTQGYFGDGQSATSAELNSPVAMALDSSGNLYIADAANNRIRKVSGGKISTYAGNGTAQYSGDGGAATSASLADPYGLAFDQQGNLYISDLNNQVIRQVTPGGTISTFAGINLYGSGGDGGPATSAYLNRPIGLAVDTAGDLYIADSNNYCIRKITTDGIIHTVAGKITASGYSGDGGPATSALMGAPFGIALDAAGNLYIADTSNNRIRMVSAATGIITTVAGNGQQGDGGDGGQATSAQLNDPEGVAVDAAGAIYISEKFGNRVRQVVNGVINTVQGSPLFEPFGLLAGPSGALYIADFGNDVIRLLTPNAPSVAGIVSASAFGAFTSAAPGSWIEIYGTNLAFSRRFWGAADFSGSNAPTSLDGTSVTIGGQPAAVYYISGGQVNAQVPTGVSPGSQAITVKNAAGTSSSVSVNLAATEPGLLTQFKVNSVQYVSALFSDNTTYAMPANAVSGLPSRPAKAGDVITMYGIGFGPVTPAVSSGQIAPASSCSPSCLNSQVQISIGGTPATLQYAGLAPGEVGVYQFNVVVPAVAAGNSVPVTFSLGGQAGTQTLYTAVQ